MTLFPQEQTIVPSLFPEEGGPSIPANVEDLSAQTAIVESSHNGVPVFEQIKRSRYDIETIGMDEIRRSIAEKEKQLDLRIAEESVKKAGLNDLQDTTAYYQSILKTYQEQPPKKRALEEAVISIITPKDSKEYFNDFNKREAAKNLAGRNILYDALYENGQNASFWDKALTLGRDLVPFVNSRSVAKGVAEALNKEAGWSDEVNPATIVNEFRSAYLHASPEKKQDLAAAVVHGIKKYSKFFGDDNAAQVAANLEKLLIQESGQFGETTFFDTASLPLITFGKLLGKGVNVAVEIGKPARVAASQGNTKLATDLMAHDALTGSKLSGMSPDELARQASSMNIAPLEFSFDGMKLSQQMQDKLREFSASLRGGISDTLMPGPGEHEVKAGSELLAEQYSASRNRAIYEYTPKSYESGVFTGDVVWQSPDGVPFQSKGAAELFAIEHNKIGRVEQIKPSIEPSPEELRMIEEGGPDVLREQWVFRESINSPISLKAIGQFSMADVGGRNALNLNIPYFSASKEVVEQRGLGLSANAKIRRNLEQAYKDAVRGLGGDELSNVNKALSEGDAISNQPGAFGKVWASDELRSFGLSDKGAEAYYKIRLMRDNMWLLRNRQIRNELLADGFREFAFDGNEFVGALNRPAKPVELGTIKSMVTQGKIGKVLDTRNGTIEPLTNDKLDKLYAEGGFVVKLYKPEGIGQRKYSHIIADNNSSQFRDISVALPYRPGEFARSYTDEYFITLKRNIMDEFDRTESAITETIRTAKNIPEAVKFTNAMNDATKIAIDSKLPRFQKLVDLEKLIGRYMGPNDFLEYAEKRGLKDTDVFDFHYNRESHSYLQDTIDEALTNGRLFYSHRGEKLLSVDATRNNTLSITESLGVELANISRFITSHDIRVNAIEKWMNTFGEGVVNKTFNKWIDFDKGELSADLIRKSLIKSGSPLSEASGDELLKFAEQTRKYIRYQLNIRTADQKLAEARWRKSVEWLEGRGGMTGAALDWFGPAMRNLEVADFIRKVNFHITLGMGNAAQLLVQANGMMIAAARHPIHGLAAAKTAIPLRMAMMSDNPNVWKSLATVDSLTSLGLKNANEFVDIVKAVKRSGIIDDIHSTALYNVEEGALDLYKGYGTEVFKKTSPFFFNRGEEFSRLVSWEVARREWIRANPGKPWQGDDALRAISARQKEFNLGMQSHNTAAWQQGWAGIPMQFLQYNIKLATSLLHTQVQLGKDIMKRGPKAFTSFEDGNYRGFNPKESLALLGAQIVLYGAAGNGLKTIANEIWGDESGMTEEQKMYISEGLAGGLIYTLTKEMDQYGSQQGAKLALGKRLGSFEWYSTMLDKIFTDKTDVTDFLLGATKSSGVKMIDLFMNVGRVFKYADEVTPNMVLSELSKAPEVISSWSNAVKAYTYMQNEGFVTSKDGTPIARINTKENLASYLGISTVQVQEYYDMIKDEKRLYQDLQELARHVASLQRRELQAYLDGDEKTARDLERLRWAMMPRDLGHRKVVMDFIKQKIYPTDTAMDKLRFKFETQMDIEREKFRVLDKGQ